MQPCAELPKLQDASKDEADRAYAQTVNLYGDCAAIAKGWRVWAVDVVK